MAHVIVLDSINEDIFVCGFCKSVFNSLEVFVNHKRVKCSQPDMEYKLINNLQPSVLSGSSESIGTTRENGGPSSIANAQLWPKDLTCSTCKKKFKKVKTLMTHMKTHNEKPYQCPVCGRCFIQNSHLQRHIISHKVWPDGLNETTAKTPEVELLSYTCTYCNMILSNYSQFKSHLKIHLSFKKYKCIQGGCMEFYDTLENLFDHVSTAHTSVVYHCHICHATFKSLEDIASHQQSHSNHTEKELDTKLQKYKCPQCDATFKKAEKLSLHMVMENHKKICIHCNKTFASDKRLRLHLQIHRKLKPFQCNICNTSFHMKKYLSTHMLKHGNRQFKCPVCKYMFKRQDLVQRHMRLHQPKKMFKCPFKDTLDCGKEFSRSDKLKLHIKSHTKHVSLNSTHKVKVPQSTTDINNSTIFL